MLFCPLAGGFDYNILMTPAAVLLACLSILLWSFLAFLSAQLRILPPFLIVGIAFCISGLVGLAQVRTWRVPWKTFLVGVGGLFGYHALYFSAFRHAPAVEANLINYLWPLLIVVLSPIFLKGYPLRLHHLAGASLGLLGAGLIVTGGRFSLDLSHLSGYLFAGGAAVTWAVYSLLTKRLPPFSSGAVGGFCLTTGVLSLGLYALTGQRVPLQQLIQDGNWLMLLLIGIGPMGLAFFAWDAALKRGDPRVIGALSYLTPLTSTLILVALGGNRLSGTSALAMLLIVTGAVLGSWDLLRRKIPVEEGETVDVH